MPQTQVSQLLSESSKQDFSPPEEENTTMRVTGSKEAKTPWENNIKNICWRDYKSPSDKPEGYQNSAVPT